MREYDTETDIATFNDFIEDYDSITEILTFDLFNDFMANAKNWNTGHFSLPYSVNYKRYFKNTNFYKCKSCSQIVHRHSKKRRIRSWCKKYGKIVYLRKVTKRQLNKTAKNLNSGSAYLIK